jgi:hypothetical protein
VRGFQLWFGVRPEVTPELRAMVEADLGATKPPVPPEPAPADRKRKVQRSRNKKKAEGFSA